MHTKQPSLVNSLCIALVFGAACFVWLPQYADACTTNLSLGSEGPPVTCLQQLLSLTGDYTYGSPTGFFGPVTETAVKHFQARKGIVSSGTPATTGYGTAGPATRRALLLDAIDVLITIIKQRGGNIAVTAGSGGGGGGGSGGGGNSGGGGGGGGKPDDPVKPPKITGTISVTGPVTVATTAQIPCGNGATTCVNTGKRIDAQYPTITQGSSRYWFVVNSSYMTKLAGSLNSPFQTRLWAKKTNEVFGEPAIADPNEIRDKKWITNTYQTGKGGEVLGFVHIEREDASPGAEGQGRVGLAWSTNYGDSFTYLGHIAIPFGDPERTNVAGVPYFVKDGYFYAYYLDRCVVAGREDEADVSKYTRPNIAVVRAKVTDVIAAARQGTVVPWVKYYDGKWTESGLGGKCTELWKTQDGIIHSDAAYSSHTGKAYILRQRTKNVAANQPAWISLYESADGVEWKLAKEIVSPTMDVEFGYAYQMIVDEDGSDNGVVGRKFYVYSDKDAAAGSMKLEHGTIVRWLVDLDASSSPPPTSSEPHTFTKEFSSTQGENDWYYEYNSGGARSLMEWNAEESAWKGNEQNFLIKSGLLHPGKNGGAILTWVAPHAGKVRITGTVKDANGKCGNGVLASITQNNTGFWWTQITNGNEGAVGGKKHDKEVDVAAGERVSFHVGNSDNDNQCDSTSWNPTITYQ